MQNETEEKVLQALGLCARARGLIIGTPMVLEAMRGRSCPRLVLSAADNAQNTEKKLTDKCTYYGVRLEHLACDGERLAAAIGKHRRVAAVAVSDENLCRLVQRALNEHKKYNEGFGERCGS